MKNDLSIRAAVCFRAAELIEQGHCKRTYAKKANGESTLPHNEHAIAWCAEGALCKASTDLGFPALDLFGPLRNVVGCDHIPNWNDAPERTAAEVAAALRELATTTMDTGTLVELA